MLPNGIHTLKADLLKKFSCAERLEFEGRRIEKACLMQIS
jgi:hypothetical protein